MQAFLLGETVNLTRPPQAAAALMVACLAKIDYLASLAGCLRIAKALDNPSVKCSCG